MNSEIFPPIPAETANAARAIFGRSNFFIWAGDHVAELFTDLMPLDPPAELNVLPLTLPMLFLFTIFQYMEILPDRRAVDAVRARIDWKYGLHLPLNFLEIDRASLCKFRRWLRAEPAGLQVLQTVLQRLPECSSLPCKEGGIEDAAQIVSLLCRLNRTSDVWETMSRALGAVVTTQPAWLRSISQAHWIGRYSQPKYQWGERFEKPDWEEYALGIGNDGFYLLEAVSKAGNPELACLPEIAILNKVWQEQFERIEGCLRWRKEFCAECSRQEQLIMQSKRR